MREKRASKKAIRGKRGIPVKNLKEKKYPNCSSKTGKDYDPASWQIQERIAQREYALTLPFFFDAFWKLPLRAE